MSGTTGKRVNEDWSIFNDAVQRRATGLPPRPRPGSPPGSRPGSHPGSPPGFPAGFPSGFPPGRTPSPTAGAGGIGGMPPLGPVPPFRPGDDAPFAAPPGAYPASGIGPGGLGQGSLWDRWIWGRGLWGLARRGHPVLRALFGLLLVLGILAALNDPGSHDAADLIPPATPDSASGNPPTSALPPASPATASPGLASPADPAAAPAPSSPAPSSPPPTADGAPVGVDYMQFRSVDFLGGHVVTGWHYARSGDRVPSYQYCYYSRPDTGAAMLPDGTPVTRVLLGPGRAAPAAGGTGAAEVRYDIAARPGPRPQPLPAALAADLGPAGWQAAATHCQWFDR